MEIKTEIMGIIEEDKFEKKTHKVKKIVRSLTKNIVEIDIRC